MPRRSVGGSDCWMSWPSSRIRPLVASISRLIIRSVVVLPQPTGSDQHHRLPVRDLKVEVVHGERAARVPFRHALEGDHDVALRSGPHLSPGVWRCSLPVPPEGMPGSHSKISVTGFGECSHAAAANRVRDETRRDAAQPARPAHRSGCPGHRQRPAQDNGPAPARTRGPARPGQRRAARTPHGRRGTPDGPPWPGRRRGEQGIMMPAQRFASGLRASKFASGLRARKLGTRPTVRRPACT